AVRLAPVRGRAMQARLFEFLENTTGGGAAPVEQGIESFLRQHSGRGAAIVISDFLTAGDLRRAFNLIHSAGLEIFALQILGPSELAPELGDDQRLIDCETLGHLDISPTADLVALYHEYRAAHEAELAALCRQRAGKFLSISAAEPFERVVFDTMRRRGWVV
ncbi:MAG TPA: hypothetical protein VEO95_10025, partial [Chthoniobacteraceae bacterium]|nr:hypothetical protein [Chthoniobacteraceae bacterium]